MEKYFKSFNKSGTSAEKDNTDELQISSKCARIENNSSYYASDPGLRCRIFDYHVKDREKVRRFYLLKGHFQPRNHNFSQAKFGNTLRKFNPAWFEHFPSWLEYSIEKDVAFCLFCYLFKPDMGQQSGGNYFVIEGFRNWKDGFARLREHVGGLSSIHNQAAKQCKHLMDSKKHISVSFHKQTDISKREYRTRLTVSVDCIRFLIKQGLALRGNDELDISTNQGNFLKLLKFLGDHNEEINKVILQNAPENHKITAPDIQKDIIHVMAVETTKKFIKDIENRYFSLLLDESRDISSKEHRWL